MLRMRVSAAAAAASASGCTSESGVASTQSAATERTFRRCFAVSVAAGGQVGAHV